MLSIILIIWLVRSLFMPRRMFYRPWGGFWGYGGMAPHMRPPYRGPMGGGPRPMGGMRGPGAGRW